MVIWQCVSETVPILNEKSGSPIVGVVLVIVIFIAIGIYVTLYKNPP